MRKSVSATVLAALVLLVSLATFAAKEQSAPDFALIDLLGNEITLADLKGKVIFLNFWATWCGPCRHEIPDFVEFYSQYKDKGLEIIGISVDRSERKVKDFMDQYKINYPIVMATNEIMGDYKPGRYIPTTIVINPKGHIVDKKVGLMNMAALEMFFKEHSE